MFNLGVFGIDHNSASFAIRKQIAFSIDEIKPALLRLHNSGIVQEVVILSTCNRTEVYCITQDMSFVINAICVIKNICSHNIINTHSYTYWGDDCVSHLFAVISGLKSMILGETQIVAQIKNAYHIAKTHNVVAKYLNGIFQMAFAVNRDIRNISAINCNTITMGAAIIKLIQANMNNYSKSNILFIGAGEMMREIIPYFKNLTNKITIANRNYEHAQLLMNIINANYIHINDIGQYIHEYNIIIACCSSDNIIIPYSLFIQNTIKNLTLIIDISMPLIVDDKIATIDNVKLLTIDDVATIVDVGHEKRNEAAKYAKVLIDDKLAQYHAWQHKQTLSSVIKNIYANADNIRADLLLDVKNQVQNMNLEANNNKMIDEILNNLTTKLTNKLLHMPITQFCNANQSTYPNINQVMQYLYDV